MSESGAATPVRANDNSASKNDAEMKDETKKDDEEEKKGDDEEE